MALVCVRLQQPGTGPRPTQHGYHRAFVVGPLLLHPSSSTPPPSASPPQLPFLLSLSAPWAISTRPAPPGLSDRGSDLDAKALLSGLWRRGASLKIRKCWLACLWKQGNKVPYAFNMKVMVVVFFTFIMYYFYICVSFSVLVTYFTLYL